MTLKVKLHLPENPLGIPKEQLTRTFQIARDSKPKLMIARIRPGSLADTLELKMGDVILKYDGNLVASVPDLYQGYEAARSDKVELVILRNGREIKIPAKKRESRCYHRSPLRLKKG